MCISKKKKITIIRQTRRFTLEPGLISHKISGTNWKCKTAYTANSRAPSTSLKSCIPTQTQIRRFDQKSFIHIFVIMHKQFTKISVLCYSSQKLFNLNQEYLFIIKSSQSLLWTQKHCPTYYVMVISNFKKI
jgi:hypothetical protein